MGFMDFDIDGFQDKLRIDKNSLDEEVISQAELFYQVGSACADAVSRRDYLYEALKEVDAELNLRVREKAEEEGRKVTEAIISSLVMTHEDHVSAFQEYHKAKEQVAKLEILKDAFLQRSYMLRDLAQLHISGYCMDSSVKAGASVTKEAQEVRYSENRRRIAERVRRKSA